MFNASNACLTKASHDVKANNNQRTRGKMAKTDDNKTNIYAGLRTLGVLDYATFGNTQDLKLLPQNIQQPEHPQSESHSPRLSETVECAVRSK